MHLPIYRLLLDVLDHASNFIKQLGVLLRQVNTLKEGLRVRNLFQGFEVTSMRSSVYQLLWWNSCFGCHVNDFSIKLSSCKLLRRQFRKLGVMCYLIFLHQPTRASLGKIMWEMYVTFVIQKKWNWINLNYTEHCLLWNMTRLRLDDRC